MSSIYSSYQEVVNVIINGGVVVMPTDTIYGAAASALKPDAVERVYALKQRSPEKPPIILIADVAELKKFSVAVNPAIHRVLDELWPGPTSVVLPCPDSDLGFLHRGSFSLAFRLPHKFDLKTLLTQTGPLIAPSANPEGLPPATNLNEAQAYFGDQVDGYVDGGTVTAPASRLIRMNADATYEVLRP